MTTTKREKRKKYFMAPDEDSAIMELYIKCYLGGER